MEINSPVETHGNRLKRYTMGLTTVGTVAVHSEIVFLVNLSSTVTTITNHWSSGVVHEEPRNRTVGFTKVELAFVKGTPCTM